MFSGRFLLCDVCCLLVVLFVAWGRCGVSLFVVCCWTLLLFEVRVVRCLFFGVRVVCCLLCVVCRQLSVVLCFGVCCLLFVAFCLLMFVRSLLFVLTCLLWFVVGRCSFVVC